MTARVYVHCDNGRCHAITVKETLTFGSIKELIGEEKSSETHFYSAFNTPIRDGAFVSSYLSDHNDFYLRSASGFTRETSTSSHESISDALKASPPVSLLSDIRQEGPTLSVASYSWEDREQTVEVRLPFENAKIEIAIESINCIFDSRSFSVEFCYRGKRYRFGCGRTHGSVSGCKVRLSTSSVVLSIQKANKETWFDLFKRKAVGDNDPL